MGSQARCATGHGGGHSVGPATVDVRDGGAGTRFNFPGAAQFRPISWEEWFDNFTRHDLMFVYEGDVPGQTPSGRYRLVPREKLIQRRPADHGPQEPGH